MSVLSVLAFGNNSLFMEPEPDEKILKNAEERSRKINLHLERPKNLFRQKDIFGEKSIIMSVPLNMKELFCI